MGGRNLGGEINQDNAQKIDLEADAAAIHDPQPAPLVEFRKRGNWVCRYHIDVSNPVDEFIAPPAIAPLNDKNRELTGEEIQAVLEKFHLLTDKPLILQVLRFDRFNDPTGVIKAYRLVKRYKDCCLVLAGSPANDDSEGEAVLNEVR